MAASTHTSQSQPTPDLDDTAVLVSEAIEKTGREPLDVASREQEAKVKVRVEQLQSEMLQLARDQSDDSEFQKAVLRIIEVSSKIFSRIFPEQKFASLAFGLALKSKVFVDSVGSELGENLTRFFDLKSSILLNLALCYFKKQKDDLALELLREVTRASAGRQALLQTHRRKVHHQKRDPQRDLPLHAQQQEQVLLAVLPVRQDPRKPPRTNTRNQKAA